MLQFVNPWGQPVNTAPPNTPKKKKEEPGSYHKGWRVMGIPPGSLEKAQEEHIKKARDAEKRGKPIADFDYGIWLMTARKKAVRSKPYEVHAAAEECQALAEKSGWLRVEVIAIAKEAAPR